MSASKQILASVVRLSIIIQCEIKVVLLCNKIVMILMQRYRKIYSDY